ncbi:MAG: hypothetical protein JNK05_07890 [Myxococcales bacterium]|nr:hypothetical protein [Myxococcales bacterium]
MSCERLRSSRAGDAPGDASAPRPAPRERITVGDRALVIEVSARSWTEGPITSGGHLPAFQRPGLKRSIRVTVFGSVGGQPLEEIAIVTTFQAWDRDLSPAQREDMDGGNAVIEQCADPAMPGRVAFRVRARSGRAHPAGSLRWLGAFMLQNTVSIVRRTVEAARCADALAALPRTAEAWLREEFDASMAPGSAPSGPTVRRVRVAVRDRGGDTVATEPSDGPRSISATGIVATTEGLVLDRALDWAMGSSDALPLSVYERLATALSRDDALARRALDAIDPSDARTRLGAMRAPIVSVLRQVPSAIATERAAALANALVAACSDATRAPTLCTPTRVEAIGLVAARAGLSDVCSTIAGSVVRMGTALAAGEQRGLTRLVALQTVHRCADRASARAAAMALFAGPYDYVSSSGLEQTCLSSSEQARERCADPALFAAIRLRESCGADVVRAAMDAAPSADSSLQQSAVLCLARACGGASAAQRAFDALPQRTPRAWRAPPTRDCWTEGDGDRDGSTRATNGVADESLRDAGPSDR